PRQPDYALEELQLHAHGGRVAGKAENHHLRLWNRLPDGALQLVEEVDAGRHPYRPDVGTRDYGAVNMDRIAGIGHQHGVSMVEGGEHQMREPLLGADGHDRLGIRIQRDAESALVPVADRPPQPRNSLRYGISVGIVSLRRLDQFVDDVPRCHAIGVAHAHVDDVLPALARRRLQLSGDVENVRRESLDAWEFLHWPLSGDS